LVLALVSAKVEGQKPNAIIVCRTNSDNFFGATLNASCPTALYRHHNSIAILIALWGYPIAVKLLRSGRATQGSGNRVNYTVKKIRVLIADDSAQLRSQLIENLKELSEIEIVGEAEDCPEAIFAIRALRPDVVVLDLRMPRGNGLQVLSTIRQDEHPPVVMMLSNQATTPYQTQAKRAGADYFFDKANGIDQVKQTISRIITDSKPSSTASSALSQRGEDIAG